MSKDITLGQFVAGNSPVHRLDPRTKLALMIAYIVMVFLVSELWMFVVPLAYVVAALLLSRIPVSYLYSSLKPIRFLLIFMFILNLFFTEGETIWWQWWIITISKEAVLQAIFITLRLMFLVSGSSLLTLTTSPLALTDGIERILSPLKVIRFPAHEIAMMMTIALRFIPTLMDEADKIKKAQMARGADFESGNVITRAKSMIPILVPLFVSAFRRSDELAMAMESRCYHGGEGRTKLRQLHFHWGDLVAALITGAAIAATVLLPRLLP